MMMMMMMMMLMMLAYQSSSVIRLMTACGPSINAPGPRRISAIGSKVHCVAAYH